MQRFIYLRKNFEEIDDEEVECGDSSALSTRLSEYLDNATHKK